MKTPRLSVFMGLMFLGLSAAAEAAVGVNVDPGDFEFKVELDGAAPLPLQPVRLRLVLRNVSQKRLGPIPPIDSYDGPLVKRPQDKDWRAKAMGSDFAGVTVQTARSRKNELKDARLYLGPGEQTSVSLALGLSREGQGEKEPLFIQPGLYRLKCRYLNLEKEIEVEVRALQGDDRAVYEVLRREWPLLLVLLSGRGWPDPKYVPKLQALLELYPDSSYASYLHFALARFYLRGNGFAVPRVGGVDLARSADHLEKIVKHPAPGAFLPNAYIAFRMADPYQYERDQMAGRLWDKHPDALEWLEVVAMRLTAEEWPLYRKGKLGTPDHPGAKDLLDRVLPAINRNGEWID